MLGERRRQLPRARHPFSSTSRGVDPGKASFNRALLGRQHDIGISPEPQQASVDSCGFCLLATLLVQLTQSSHSAAELDTIRLEPPEPWSIDVPAIHADRIADLTRTEIARACDWSDNLGNIAAGERHVYAIRNQAFASELAALNRERIVSPGRRKRLKRVELLVTLVVFAAMAIIAMLIPER